MARKYSKLNFVDAVKIITPGLYVEDDVSLSGYQVKLTDRIINSHLVGMSNVGTTLNISALDTKPNLSSINTVSGFGQYFIKQNKLTKITSYNFDKKILRPLGYSYTDYKTSATFHDFLSGTLLPKITLNLESLHTDTSSVFATTASGTHEFLISELSWLYFLNTSGPVMDPSTIVASSITEKFYNGKSYLLNDGIKDYQKYLWDNYSNFSSIDSRMIPEAFLSGTGTYTSGNQNLSKLQTLDDVIYSPLYIDREDTAVGDAIESYLGDASTLLSTTEAAGPFSKFLRALSYSLRDIDNEVESLDTLYSIESCPSEFLPYLANLLGWTLYGNNDISWRNQISNAIGLYKKKGTKKGLVDALNTVIIQNPIEASSIITEMYESYIPRLLYYLLITETGDLFDLNTYTVEDAIRYGIIAESYSSTNRDQNIRAAVDSIIMRAVERFPYLFFIKNQPFRVSILENGTGWLGPVIKIGESYYTGTSLTSDSKRIAIIRDPNFFFDYRNTLMPIPPWDDEKFYRNCMVTNKLLIFLKEELARFCVDPQVRSDTYDYISDYTINSNDDTDLYLQNGYVFFTSALQYPPNYTQILDEMDYKDYDDLSLWSGKSSTYDFTVCAGDFSSVLFQDSSSLYTKNEILDTLSIVDEFSPAKAIPRTRVILGQSDYTSGLDFICPSIRYRLHDVPDGSGALSNYDVCGVFDRGTGFALGLDKYPSYDDSRSVVEHQNVPVFNREQNQYSNNIVDSVVNTSETVPTTSSIPRRSIRRRNFYNTLTEKGWFGRDGYNMPSFYNNTSSNIEYLPLGIIPSSLSFADGSPENLSGVYSKECASQNSIRSYFGLNVSASFLSRGYETINFASCDQFVRRDLLPEEVYTLFKFEEMKKNAIASDTVNLNYELLAASAPWYNIKRSLANKIEDTGFSKFISPVLDKRVLSHGDKKGIQEVYNTYNNYFLSSIQGINLPESLLLTLEEGGPNILSHTYGPIYFNANFTLNGSSIDNAVSIPNGIGTDAITTRIDSPYIINLNEFGTSFTGVSANTLSATPYYGDPEYIANNLLSGVSIIDTSASPDLSANNRFIIYDLAPNQATTLAGHDNYLIGNRCIFAQTSGTGLPRIKFDLSGLSPEENNVLIPEHEFELNLDFLSGKLDTATLGGGQIGVTLRTKTEQTIDGRSVVFFWTPANKWEMIDVSSVSDPTVGISNVVYRYAHLFGGKEPHTIYQDTLCNTNIDNYSILKYINKNHISKASLKFHTKNQLTKVPFSYGTYYDPNNSGVYNGRSVQLHRADILDRAKSQNYIIEVFQVPKNNPEKEFIIFNKLNVVDKTLNNAAKLPYTATIPDITDQRTSTPSRGYSFLLPDKRNLDDLAFTSLFNEITPPTNPYETADLFRNMPAGSLGIADQHPCRINSELWSVAGEPNIDRYQIEYQVSPVAIPWNPGAAIVQYLPATYPESGDSSILFGNKIPWGKIPFTGICNNTWTAHNLGMDFSDYNSGANLLATRERMGRMTDYWNARKGFLSFNEWSPYINTGYRRIVGGIANPNYTLGQGVDLYHWPQKMQESSNQSNYMGRPLLGLARPGHSSTEQFMDSQDRAGQGPVDINNGETNPLGFRRIDDQFDYADLYDFVPGTNAYFDNLYGIKPSVGTPIMLDFTSKRVVPTFTESSPLSVQLSQLENPNNWNYSPGPDSLLSTIQDPLGYVPSALAIDQIIKVPTQPATQANPNPERLDIFSDAWNGQTILSNIEGEGHGITFPPMSVYRDVERAKLVNGKTYSFSVFVRGNASTDSFIKNRYATSAIVTISPIGSKTSYTRYTLKIPDYGSGDSAAAQTMQGGTSLALSINQSTDAEVYSVPKAEDPTDTVTWYKIRVSLPYDAFEEDISGEQNLGLRCTVQAYNDRFDNSMPDDPAEALGVIPGTDQGPNQESGEDTWTYIPCKLLTWGYSLYPQGVVDQGVLGTFRRTTGTLTKVGKQSFDQTVRGPLPGNGQNAFREWPGNIDNVVLYDSNVNNTGTDAETDITLAPVNIIQDNFGELSLFDKGASSLQKLTLVERAAPNPNYPSKLYDSIDLYDTSGIKYKGPIVYSLSRKLLRDANFESEVETARVLSVSGGIGGTNIGRQAKGVIPINPQDLLRLFRYFNRMGKKGTGVTPGGFNTRVAADSSGIHDLSGGSRLSYRSNPDNASIGTKDGTHENYTNIDIIN